MRVNLRDILGRQIIPQPIDINPSSTTIRELKERVLDGTGVAIYRQRLIYSGIELNDDEKLVNQVIDAPEEEPNNQPNIVIRLVVRDASLNNSSSDNNNNNNPSTISTSTSNNNSPTSTASGGLSPRSASNLPPEQVYKVSQLLPNKGHPQGGQKVTY